MISRAMLRGMLFLSLAGALAAATAAFPQPAMDVKPSGAKSAKAVFAGGCFWCTEAVFELLKGVTNVVSGYAGGTKETAAYEVVGRGSTDHAEAIEITYDPSKVTYGQLLKVFFATAHDPTQLNRQGPDWGRQYRSEIFAVGEEQLRVAKAYIEQLNAAKVFSKPIVTLVSPLKAFYTAEKYHQDFVRLNPDHGYVVVNSRPKVEKTRKLFPELVK